MTRTIHLAVFSNGTKPAHWAIWIPTGDTGSKGRLIQVNGNPATGFFMEFQRNYNLEDYGQNYEIIPLAEVPDNYIADTKGNGSFSIDTTARDRLESVATTVAPPGRSPNPFDPNAENCQNWIESLVEKLIADGHLSSSSATVLQSAPRYI